MGPFKKSWNPANYVLLAIQHHPHPLLYLFHTSTMYHVPHVGSWTCMHCNCWYIALLGSAPQIFENFLLKADCILLQQGQPTQENGSDSESDSSPFATTTCFNLTFTASLYLLKKTTTNGSPITETSTSNGIHKSCTSSFILGFCSCGASGLGGA